MMTHYPAFVLILLVATGGAHAQDAATPEAAAAAPAQPQPLNLTCKGTGVAKLINSTTATFHGSDGGSATGFGTSTSRSGYDGQVDVRLFTGDDRIRLPRTIVPPISGGDNGWFKIKNPVVTDREITANAAINFVNTPKIRIDRVAGTIEVSGMNGSFSGDCRKVDPEVDKPKF